MVALMTSEPSLAVFTRPAPFFRVSALLGETEAAHLLAAVRAQTDVTPAGAGTDGLRLPDAGLVPPRLPERLEELRATARQALGVPDFTPAGLEAEIIAWGGGPAPRAPDAASERVLAGFYFFHAVPKGFSGGGVRLGSILPPERGGSSTDITPEHDSLVLFPAWAPHHLLPASPAVGPAETSFAVRLWMHRERPEAQEVAAGAARSYATLAAAFTRDRHVILTDCITSALRRRLVRHYEEQIARNRLKRGDAQSDRYVAHNDPFARMVHQALRPAVESVVGRPVKPSYVYASLYNGGAVLERHLDRPQCQYTLSLLIDYRPEPEAGAPAPWPVQLYLEPDAPPEVLRQPLGGGLLFMGREVEHARPALAADHRCWVLLLHYVDAAFAGSLD